MKFIVSSNDLLRQIQLLGGVLNSSNTLPILDNFLFELNDGSLNITASDLETTISAEMTVESKENGSIAIPARLLLDTLKSFPEQPLTFSIATDTGAIEISSDFGKYKLAGYNSEEFPQTPEISSPSKVTLSADVLATAINKSVIATGNDDLRPIMTGIFFEFSTDQLRFVSTDAHKLVRYTRTDAKADSNAGFTVPKKPLNLLKSNLGDSDITLEFNENNARFSFDNIVLTCRLIDGNFPNYSVVIPDKNPNHLTVNRSSFLGSLKRVAIFASKTNHQVRLKIAGSELTISAEDIDFSNEANERLSCSYEGEDIEIGFNSRFLIEMVSNIDTDEIIVEMSTSDKAGIILPSESAIEGEDLLMLIMPVML